MVYTSCTVLRCLGAIIKKGIMAFFAIIPSSNILKLLIDGIYKWQTCLHTFHVANALVLIVIGFEIA